MNVLRRKVLPVELEQLREALKTLLPKAVSRDELNRILTADLRMLVQHGVSLEGINQKLAAHHGHITQSFYDMLGRAPRRRRSTSLKQEDAFSPAGPSMEEGASTTSSEAERPPESAVPSEKTEPSDSKKASSKTGSVDQVKVGVLHPKNASSEALAVNAGLGERNVDWRQTLRQPGSRSD